jgi:translation initiation factor 4A
MESKFKTVLNNNTITEATEKIDTFQALYLKEHLLKGNNIIKQVFTNMASQNHQNFKEALPALINSNNDIIIQGNNGTGKTSSYIINALQKIDESSNVIQILVFCPTRELATNAFYTLKNISKYMNVKICIVIGGTMIRETVKELGNYPQIVICTPGRGVDFIKKGC